MEFRVLGPLEVRDGERVVSLGGSKQRALLGVLLLHANEVVAADLLVDELWGENPPGSAAKLVQGYVSGLRRALSSPGHDPQAGPLITQAPGYVLRLVPGQIDLDAFERLVAQARATTDPAAAADALRRALALWRGPALADLALEGHARREAERLDERRLAALGERIELDLELGLHADLIGELEALIAKHPFQERLSAQLMLALYGSGRQAEALDVYRSTRARLVDELGLEPGEPLQRLERRILAHDPTLDAPRRARPSAQAAPAPEPQPPAEPTQSRVRKTVTVVFADLVGFTALAEGLDPESIHEVQQRFFERTAEVLERHGGTVEKYIGDAAVAVFGVPIVHEDDALRAVRAAAELRASVAELSVELERDLGLTLRVSVAVNTGEVVTGLASRQSLASGDAMIVAARLEQAADADEILLGPDTYRLVQHAVRAEELEPLAIKGRATPVAAWRLLELTPHVPLLAAEPSAPLVGRTEELTTLQDALAGAIDDRACRLCTIVGSPGIGKSRLVRELVDSIDDALVLVGRCLPYGEGVTFWPLSEIVRQVAGAEPVAQIVELLEDDDRAALIAERIAGALGLAESAGPPEETFWAVRRLFERLAKEQPLIVVVDDIHWAEQAMLDLLEYVHGFSSGAPILLVCLARPELLEHRPAWAAPRPSATLIPLEPLSHDESRLLLRQLHDEPESDDGLAGVVAAAEGNPLFLEQLHAFRSEAGGARQPIPPSIHALLAARIDRLAPDERTVLERASIEGRTFHLGGLATLLPSRLRADLATHLLALVRKEFIHSDRAGLPGEDAFRFRHILIRDAAYGAVSKRDRADLHERFAGWVEHRMGERRAELDDIVGYHLEQAFWYRESLGIVDDAGRVLARRASGLLASAGYRAFSRGDMAAAASLLGRAAALRADDAPSRLALLPDLGLALTEAGELTRAELVLRDAMDSAATAGDRVTHLNAVIEYAALHLLSQPDSDIDELLAQVESCLPELETLGDDRGQGRAWYLIGLVRGIWAGRYGVVETALARALTHVRRTGDRRQEADILNRLAFSAFSGPTPIPDAIARCNEILESAAGDPALEAGVLRWLAALEARRANFDEGRRLIARAIERYEELGRSLMSITVRAFGWGDLELLAENYGAAERELRRGYEILEEMGEQRYRSSVAAYLARAVYAQGRYDEAKHLTHLSEETAADDDTWSQVLFRTTRAKALARRGSHDDAHALAFEALAIVEHTDLLDLHGDTLLDVGEVLRLAGRADESSAAIERALELFGRRANVVAAARARAQLAEAVGP